MVFSLKLFPSSLTVEEWKTLILVGSWQSIFLLNGTIAVLHHNTWSSAENRRPVNALDEQKSINYLGDNKPNTNGIYGWVERRC